MPGCNSPDEPTPSPDVGATSETCRTCTVTATPTPLTICGATNTSRLTATGTPTGGTYAWRSSDTAVATVAATGANATVTAVSEGTADIEVTYTVSGCGPCTDTVSVDVCTCTSGNHYASAYKAVAHLNGAKARIKTRYGKLCCEDEGCGTDHALHCTYLNVSNETGGLRWAQTGYGRERNAGSAAIAEDRYAEIQGNVYQMIKVPAPAEGTVHEYKIQLNPATGRWSFYFDGTRWRSIADPYWRGKRGTSVQWTGEIHNIEDDMSGTAADKCSFTECQYRVRGSLAFQDAGLVAGDVQSDDNARWGAERVSGTAINIWDKNPN